MTTVPPFRAEPLLALPHKQKSRSARGSGSRLTPSSPPHIATPGTAVQVPYPSPSPTRGSLPLAADGESAGRHTSKSPVPCVAHESYTFHKNCGCHPSPIIAVRAPAAAAVRHPSSSRHHHDRPISPSLRAQSAVRMEAYGGEDCDDATSTLAIADASVLFFVVQVAHDGLHSTVFSLELVHPRSVVDSGGDPLPPDYAIVERDVLSSRRYARHHAPLRRLCQARRSDATTTSSPPARSEAQPVPTSMALVGWDHLWVGMSDGSILSWRKTASGDTTTDNVVSDDVTPIPPPSLAAAVHFDMSDASATDDGRRSPPLHSKHSVSSPDGRKGVLEGPTVLYHWSRVASPHDAPLISMLTVAPPTHLHHGSTIVPVTRPADAIYTICGDGVVYRWSQGRQGEAYDEYYSYDGSDDDNTPHYTPVLPWKPTAIATPRGLAVTAARCAAVLLVQETSTASSSGATSSPINAVEVLSVGMKSGSTYVWRLHLRDLVAERNDVLTAPPAKLEPTATATSDESPSALLTSPTKSSHRKQQLSPTASRRQSASSKKHVSWSFGGVSAVCMIPSLPSPPNANRLALAVGHDNGSVALWMHSPTHAIVEDGAVVTTVEENSWYATSVFDPRCLSPVCSLALISSVKLWCLSLSGECVVLDLLHMEERTRRRVWRGVTGKRASPKRHQDGDHGGGGAPWCAAQLTHVQFVSGHVLWATGRNDGALTTMFVPTSSAAVQPADAHAHGGDPSLLSLDNASFSPALPQPLASSAEPADIALTEFERLERLLSGSDAEERPGERQSPQTTNASLQQQPIAAEGYFAFVSHASRELEDVQARLDEHMVLLHEVMENELNVLSALRKDDATAVAAAAADEMKQRAADEAAAADRDRLDVLEELLVAKDAAMVRMKDELSLRDATIATLQHEMVKQAEVADVAAALNRSTTAAAPPQHSLGDSALGTSISPLSPQFAVPAHSGSMMEDQQHLHNTIHTLQQQLYQRELTLQTSSLEFSEKSAEYEQTIASLRAELSMEQMTSQQIMCDMQDTIESQQALESRMYDYEVELKDTHQSLTCQTEQFEASKSRYKEALLNANTSLVVEKARGDSLELDLQQVQDMLNAIEEENRGLRDRLTQAASTREPQQAAQQPSTLIRRRSRRETPGDEFRRFLAAKTPTEELLDTMELALTQLASGAALAHERAIAAAMEAQDAATQMQHRAVLSNSNSVCSRCSTAQYALEHHSSPDVVPSSPPPTAIPGSIVDRSTSSIEHTSGVSSDHHQLQIDELQAKCAALEAALADAQQGAVLTAAQWRSATMEVESQRVLHVEQLAAMEERLALLTNDVQAAAAQRAATQEELDRALEANHSMAQLHRQEKLQLISRASGETQDLGEKYAIASTEVESLRSQLQAAEVHVQLLHDRNVRLTTDSEAASVENARQRAASEVTLLELRQDRDDLQYRLEEVASDLASSKSALQRTEQVLAATQEAHDPQSIRFILEETLKERDASVAMASALKNELALLTTSEYSMRRAADELALRVAVCEQEVGNWQAKANDAEERYRRDQVDLVTAQSLVDQLRLREKDAQEEAWDARRQLHEHVQLGKEALDAEVRLRTAVENKCRDMDAQLRRAQGSWNDQTSASEEISRAFEAKVRSQADTIRSLESELEELRALVHYNGNGTSTKGSSKALIPGSSSSTAQLQSLQEENVSLRIHISELEHIVIQADDIKRRHTKEILALKALLSSQTDMMSSFATVSPKVRRKSSRPGVPSESPIKTPLGRDVSGYTVTSPLARDPRNASSKKAPKDTVQRPKQIQSSHHHHHHDGTHDVGTCVWCANLTVKSMGGTFGVCGDNPHRLQEFQHSASAGHPSSQPQSHSVSPMPRTASNTPLPPPAPPAHHQRSMSAGVLQSSASMKSLERVPSASSAVMSLSSTAPFELVAPIVASIGHHITASLQPQPRQPQQQQQQQQSRPAEGSVAVRELYFSSFTTNHHLLSTAAMSPQQYE